MVHRLSFFCVPEKQESNTGLHQQDEWTMRSFSAEWRAWHISPRLYTNKTLDLMRTNCLPRWCFWRHDTPLTRVSVCLCARSNSPVNAVGFVWVSVFCLWNVGVVPTRFTNNRPVQTVREWQRMLRQPKQRTQAHSTVFDPLLEENPPYMVESGRGVIRRSPIYLGSSTTFL